MTKKKVTAAKSPTFSLMSWQRRRLQEKEKDESEQGRRQEQDIGQDDDNSGDGGMTMIGHKNRSVSQAQYRVKMLLEKRGDHHQQESSSQTHRMAAQVKPNTEYEYANPRGTQSTVIDECDDMSINSQSTGHRRTFSHVGANNTRDRDRDKDKDRERSRSRERDRDRERVGVSRRQSTGSTNAGNNATSTFLRPTASSLLRERPPALPGDTLPTPEVTLGIA